MAANDILRYSISCSPIFVESVSEVAKVTFESAKHIRVHYVYAIFRLMVGQIVESKAYQSEKLLVVLIIAGIANLTLDYITNLQVFL